MAGLKTKMLIATILAVLLALLLAEATLTLFPPEELSKPIPMPQPKYESQLVWTLQWLGLAAIISFLIVGTAFLAMRALNRKNQS
ncbi:MAG: hypothetical protein ACQCN3_10150 [Candidatus Bathyarchaeia archaeon]